MVISYGRDGCLTTLFVDSRPGQSGGLLIMPAGGAMPGADRRAFEDLNHFGELITGPPRPATAARRTAVLEYSYSYTVVLP